MRTTLKDVVQRRRRHKRRPPYSFAPPTLADWWYETPIKTRIFWSTLLFAPGQGWLRWGLGEAEWGDYIPGAHATMYTPYTVAPPARRLAIYLTHWPVCAWLMVVGIPPDDITPRRYRFSWEEARPCWPSDMRDEERTKELWR